MCMWVCVYDSASENSTRGQGSQQKVGRAVTTHQGRVEGASHATNGEVLRCSRL